MVKEWRKRVKIKDTCVCAMNNIIKINMKVPQTSELCGMLTTAESATEETMGKRESSGFTFLGLLSLLLHRGS